MYVLKQKCAVYKLQQQKVATTKYVYLYSLNISKKSKKKSEGL